MLLLLRINLPASLVAATFSLYLPLLAYLLALFVHTLSCSILSASSISGVTFLFSSLPMHVLREPGPERQTARARESQGQGQGKCQVQAKIARRLQRKLVPGNFARVSSVYRGSYPGCWLHSVVTYTIYFHQYLATHSNASSEATTPRRARNLPRASQTRAFAASLTVCAQGGFGLRVCVRVYVYVYGVEGGMER